METLQLEAFAKPEVVAGHELENHHHKSDTDSLAPLGGNDAPHEDQIAADDVVDEYPSVVRRTIIVIGVALALFCVRHQFSVLRCQRTDTYPSGWHRLGKRAFSAPLQSIIC